MVEFPPKILINNTNKDVEFKCGGFTYLHPKGKTLPYEGFVAYHALHQVNTGLEEYIEHPPEPVGRPTKSLEELAWPTLLKKASKEGVYETGMDKETIIAKLKELSDKAV
jgi:hypothetical protein